MSVKAPLSSMSLSSVSERNGCAMPDIKSVLATIVLKQSSFRRFLKILFFNFIYPYAAPIIYTKVPDWRAQRARRSNMLVINENIRE
jgi:hypothetical protein